MCSAFIFYSENNDSQNVEASEEEAEKKDGQKKVNKCIFNSH